MTAVCLGESRNRTAVFTSAEARVAQRIAEQRLAAIETFVDLGTFSDVGTFADLGPSRGRHPRLTAEVRRPVDGNPLLERFRGRLTSAPYRFARQSGAPEAHRPVLTDDPARARQEVSVP
ncbi:BTAD domain-containing putative transcriptional regulator [Streptomyces humi]